MIFQRYKKLTKASITSIASCVSTCQRDVVNLLAVRIMQCINLKKKQFQGSVSFIDLKVQFLRVIAYVRCQVVEEKVSITTFLISIEDIVLSTGIKT
jgi:hypothetical protein